MEATAATLPTAVYSSEQVRALDRIAIEQLAIPGIELMERAAQAAFDALRGRWPAVESALVFCGAGNNAGDGYLVARLGHLEGLDVRVVAVGDPERLRGDAARAFRRCAQAGVSILAWPTLPDPEFAPDVVVDALLGTGLARDLDGAFAAAVEHINNVAAPVLALDVPTGIDSDTGLPRGVAVHADLTVTFVGLKQGLFLGMAPDYCGALAFAGLGIAREAAQGIEPVMARLAQSDLDVALPRRARTAHKGANGRLLLVGGGPGMAGAIRLAGEAALRAGAGLVYVATHETNVVSVLAGRPEIICRAVDAPADLDVLLAACDGVVLGPGLGQTKWADALWRRVVRTHLPLVLDADGLNLLARHPLERAHWVLTPHPGEASRLLNTTGEAVGRDRLAAARSMAARFNATTVLKGACSLVAQPHESGAVSIAVCDRGNPGMATAGTGDVLSGVLGALLVQCGDVGCAARAGVLLHALAGDDAAADGERGMVASDLLAHIRRRANPR